VARAPLEIGQIALLHPGDQGSAVGAALLRGGFRVACSVAGRSPRTQQAARRAGLEARACLESLLGDADLVLSLVPQEHALATAEACARVLRERRGARPRPEAPLYLDANSIAPASARAIARLLEAAGAIAVDGAFLGSARELEARGSLLLSGAHAEALAAALARALRVRVVGAEPGLASAFKLCFSGFNKAVVAAAFESLCAAERAGFAGPLLACLRDFYPGTLEALERQLPTYPRHAARRAQEMADVSAWLAALSSSHELADASRTTFARVARAELDAARCWDLAGLIRELAQRAALSIGAPRGAGDPDPSRGDA